MSLHGGGGAREVDGRQAGVQEARRGGEGRGGRKREQRRQAGAQAGRGGGAGASMLVMPCMTHGCVMMYQCTGRVTGLFWPNACRGERSRGPRSN